MNGAASGTPRPRPRSRTRELHGMFTAPGLSVVVHPLSRQFPACLPAPADGDLHLWRYASGWLPVPVPEGEIWLSQREREQARLHPNPGQRRSLVAARIVQRWIVAQWFGCEPGAVRFEDNRHGRAIARHPDGHGDIVVHTTYGGIWTVIALASIPIGLAVRMPARAMTLSDDTPLRDARHQSLVASMDHVAPEFGPDTLAWSGASAVLNLPAAGHRHVIDIPMPGKICAAVSAAQRITQIHAVGWRGE